MGKVLTDAGKAFIRKIASASGDKLILDSGITYSQKEYGENLIKWFDEYSSFYGLDANIIAAQCYAESGYKVKVFSKYKGNINAMGISQFVLLTLNERLFTRRDKNLITDEDVKAIVGDIELIYDKRFNTAVLPGSERKKILDNVGKNPNIMIKLQCNYMSQIGDFNKGLASTSLFVYNRGGYGRKHENYGEAIKKCKIDITEGVNYVDKIFNNLNKNFGYTLNTEINVSPFTNS